MLSEHVHVGQLLIIIILVVFSTSKRTSDWEQFTFRFRYLPSGNYLRLTVRLTYNCVYFRVNTIN